MTGTAIISTHSRRALQPRLSQWRVALLIIAVSALTACAGYNAKEVDVESYRLRAMVQSQGAITVSTAVPDQGETEQLTGIDLYDQGIQPVWLEIKNNGEHPVRVALWSIDKDYYSPIEVAYMNRGGLSAEGEADMQRWFYENRMERFVPAGESRSGFVYTHLMKGTKGFNLDLYANRNDYNFTFFVPMPGFTADYETVDFENLYPEELIFHASPDDVLQIYTLLDELLICCSTDEKGTRMGDPINLVLIGSGLAVRRAMLRAGWHETAANDPTTARAREHHYRGRPPDATFHQYRPDGAERKELRLWLTPAKVGEDWIWMAQVSNDISAVGKTSDFTDFHIDPDVDAARRFTSQIVWYSQSMARFGIVGGVGEVSEDEPRQNFSGEEYFTDGMRAVLWLSETPVALDDAIIENLLQLKLKEQ